MAITNFIPELWSKRVMQNLQNNLVFGNLCNRDYEGEIRNAGDTVRITSIGAVTVASYTKDSTSISPQTLSDSQTSLLIDQVKYFCFEIDDVDSAQNGGVVMATAMDDAAYRLRDTADTYIGSLYGSAGTTVTATAINSVNAFAAVLTAAESLTENDVPMEGRWIVIPPWFYTKLLLAKVLVEQTSNDAFTNGLVGRCGGFDVHVSNNLTVDTNTMVLAGTKKAITYAEQVNKVEAFRPESAFSDAVKGLHLYGAKVVYPGALVNLQCTEAAEP